LRRREYGKFQKNRDENWKFKAGEEVKPIMEVNIWQLLAGFVAAMGIPSAIMGLIVWRLEGRISKRERDHEEQDKSQKDLIVLLVQSTSASIALGEATAKAVQRIPDAHCNGDMHAALEYATNIKHKQKEFLTKQGIDALLD